MFNKDEKYIKKTFGKSNPFVVPKGYFDEFSSRINNIIKTTEIHSRTRKNPEVKVRTVSIWSRPRRFAVGIAASVCMCIFSLGAYLHVNQGSHQDISSAEQVNVEHQYTDNSNIDAMVDYSMMDTEDMYAYMADLY